MNDLIPLGTGNSRFLKSGISPNTTYQQLLTMLINGTFPFDFNGINPAGISQMGSAYNVANVLPEDVCSALGIPTTSEPKDAFSALSSIAGSKAQVKFGSYIGTDAATRTLTFDDVPRSVFVYACSRHDGNWRRSLYLHILGSANLANGSYIDYACASASDEGTIRNCSWSTDGKSFTFTDTTSRSADKYNESDWTYYYYYFY